MCVDVSENVIFFSPIQINSAFGNLCPHDEAKMDLYEHARGYRAGTTNQILTIINKIIISTQDAVFNILTEYRTEFD